MSDAVSSSKVSQRCRECGWVIPASIGRLKVRCPKCGTLNMIKGFDLSLDDLDKIFMRIPTGEED